MAKGFHDSEKLGLILHRCYVKTRRVLDRYLEPRKLNARHYSILCMTSSRPYNQLEIANRMDLNVNVLVRLIDDLEKRQLVRREPNPKDARERLIVPTKAGLAEFDISTELLRSAHEELLGHFSAEKRKAFLQLINEYLVGK